MNGVNAIDLLASLSDEWDGVRLKTVCDSISFAKERRAVLITATVNGHILLEAMRK